MSVFHVTVPADWVSAAKHSGLPASVFAVGAAEPADGIVPVTANFARSASEASVGIGPLPAETNSTIPPPNPTLQCKWSNIHERRLSYESPACQLLVSSGGSGGSGSWPLEQHVSSFVAPSLVLPPALDQPQDDDADDASESVAGSSAAGSRKPSATSKGMQKQLTGAVRATSVALSASCDRLVCGTDGGAITLVALPSSAAGARSGADDSSGSGGGLHAVSLSGHCADVTFLSWFPSDAVVLSTSIDMSTRVWSGTSPTAAAAVPAHAGGERKAARVLAGGPSGHSGGILCAEMLPHCRGRRIVTGGRDGLIKVWQVGSGTCIATVRAGTAVHGLAVLPLPTAHLAPAAGAASVDPDGASMRCVVAAACDDGTVRFYDLIRLVSATGAVTVTSLATAHGEEAPCPALVGRARLPLASHAFSVSTCRYNSYRTHITTNAESNDGRGAAAQTTSGSSGCGCGLVVVGGDRGSVAVIDASRLLVGQSTTLSTSDAAATEGIAAATTSAVIDLPVIWEGAVGPSCAVDGHADVCKVVVVPVAPCQKQGRGSVAEMGSSSSPSAAALSSPTSSSASLLSHIRAVVAQSDGTCCVYALHRHAGTSASVATEPAVPGSVPSPVGDSDASAGISAHECSCTQLASFTGPRGGDAVRDVDVRVDHGGDGNASYQQHGDMASAAGNSAASAGDLAPLPRVTVATACNDGLVRVYRMPTQVTAHLVAATQ